MRPHRRTILVLVLTAVLIPSLSSCSKQPLTTIMIVGNQSAVGSPTCADGLQATLFDAKTKAILIESPKVEAGQQSNQTAKQPILPGTEAIIEVNCFNGEQTGIFEGKRELYPPGSYASAITIVVGPQDSSDSNCWSKLPNMTLKSVEPTPCVVS